MPRRLAGNRRAAPERSASQESEQEQEQQQSRALPAYEPPFLPLHRSALDTFNNRVPESHTKVEKEIANTLKLLTSVASDIGQRANAKEDLLAALERAARASVDAAAKLQQSKFILAEIGRVETHRWSEDNDRQAQLRARRGAARANANGDSDDDAGEDSDDSPGEGNGGGDNAEGDEDAGDGDEAKARREARARRKAEARQAKAASEAMKPVAVEEGVWGRYKSAYAEKMDAYEERTSQEKYGNTKEYIDFRRTLWDAQNPDVPMPSVRHWFDDDDNGGDGRGGAGAATGADEGSDDELEVSRERVSYRCPITQTPFVRPVTARECKHSFEKDAILQMLRQQRGAMQCPMPGCAKTLKASSLEDDDYLLIKMKRYNERMEREMRRVRQLEDEDEDEGGNLAGSQASAGAARSRKIKNEKVPAPASRTASRRAVVVDDEGEEEGEEGEEGEHVEEGEGEEEDEDEGGDGDGEEGEDVEEGEGEDEDEDGDGDGDEDEDEEMKD